MQVQSLPALADVRRVRTRVGVCAVRGYTDVMEPGATGTVTVPACLRCGACCLGEAGWVHIAADDDARIEEHHVLRSLVEITVRGGMQVHSVRMVRGACAALRSVDGDTRCAGYEARPAVCRALERGSAECLAALARRAATESVPPGA